MRFKAEFTGLANRMILVVTLVVCATLGIGISRSSAGPLGLQATGGWFTEQDAVFVGVGARIGVAMITVIPNAEYVFVDNGSTYTLNLDGTINVLPLGVGTGYLGAGLAFFTQDPKNGTSDTKTGVNLIAGFGLNQIPLKPFAQFKWIAVGDRSPLVFALGARF
jgi:hypothetical protein